MSNNEKNTRKDTDLSKNLSIEIKKRDLQKKYMIKN